MKKALKLIMPLTLLLLAFYGGYVLGSASAYKKHFRFEDREEYKERILSKLDSKLGLSLEQKQSIEVILEEKGQQFEDLKKQLKPQFKQIHDESRDKIKALLDDRQKDIYLKFEAKMKKRFENK